MDNIDIGGALPIKEFKFEYMVDHPAIVMIAKRGSGKSWVCRALVKHFEKIPVGVIMSKSDRVDPFFCNFFPDTFIYYNYKSELIEKIIRRQEDIIEKCNTKIKEKGKRIDTRIYLIMDDCMSQKSIWIRDQPIQLLLFEGRHSHITYVLTMQFPLGIPPELRVNFDYIFMLADDSFTNMKKLYDHYASIFPTYDMFRQTFLKLTDDHGCMVICKRSEGNNLFDKVFHYKAPNIDNNDIKVGCYQFRKYHEKNYNDNWYKESRDNNNFDLDAYASKKKKDKSSFKIKIKDSDKS